MIQHTVDRDTTGQSLERPRARAPDVGPAHQRVEEPGRPGIPGVIVQALREIRVVSRQPGSQVSSDR
jgi:hypothetical protein